MSAFSKIALQCPTCGGEVPLYNRFSHVVVCPFCQSTLIYGEEALRVKGKQSVLPPSRLPIKVGLQGKIQGKDFIILGRIRYQWERGYWDEWFIGFDDGSFAWLTEEDGEIMLENVGKFPKNFINWEKTQVGENLQLLEKSWKVLEKNTAVCIGGEGQLPFELVPQERIYYLELESEDGTFGTYEIDEDGARLFYGNLIPFKDLNIAIAFTEALPVARPHDEGTTLGKNTKVLSCKYCGGTLEIVKDEKGFPLRFQCAYCGSVNSLADKEIQCPNCQASVKIRSGDAASAVRCHQCGALINTEGAQPQLIQLLKKKRKSRIPLGTKLQWQGKTYECVGCLIYQGKDDEDTWIWEEFLFYNPEEGYLWIEHEGGNLSIVEKVQGPKIGKNFPDQLNYENQTYRRYLWDTKAKLLYVEGEMPWIAKIGDQFTIIEYTAFPQGYSLSFEISKKEYECYKATYLPRKAFYQSIENKKIKLPVPLERAINKPYPYWLIALKRWSLWSALLLVLIAFSLPEGQLKKQWSLSIKEMEEDDPFVSEWLTLSKVPTVIKIKIRSKGLEQYTTSDIEYYEVYISGALVPEDTTLDVFPISASLWFESGYDEGEFYQEKEAEQSMLIRMEKSKKVRLVLSGESMLDSDKVNPIEIAFYENSVHSSLIWTAAVIIGILWFILLIHYGRAYAQAIGQEPDEEDD